MRMLSDVVKLKLSVEATCETLVQRTLDFNGAANENHLLDFKCLGSANFKHSTLISYSACAISYQYSCCSQVRYGSMEHTVRPRVYGAAAASTPVTNELPRRSTATAPVPAPSPIASEGTDPNSRTVPAVRVEAATGNARAAGNVYPALYRPPPKRVRKERGPNWQPAEIDALIQAKRSLFLEELDTPDARDLMTADSGKWMRISAAVMRAGMSPCHRDGPACKSKWNQLIPEYKRIADFLARTGRNAPDYWSLSTWQRKAEGLPRVFPVDVFYSIHDWYGSRPSIMPPHTRDLLSLDDSNYTTARATTEDIDHDRGSDDDSDDPIAVAAALDCSDGQTASTQSPPTQVGSAKARALLGLRQGSPIGNLPSAPKSTLPTGVTPQLLSSSDTVEGTGRHRPGNTGIRRKNMSGHSLIAEATKATGQAMAGQMREMADASREVERSKIEVQLRLFGEQMEFQRERDRRLHDNARTANDNARLAIEKQAQVVQCLADLSGVLSTGLKQQSEGIRQSASGLGPVRTDLAHGNMQIAQASTPVSAAEAKDGSTLQQ